MEKIRNIIRESLLFEDLKEEIYRMIVESQGISDEITIFIRKNKTKILNAILASIGGGVTDKNGIEKSVSSLEIPSFVKIFLNKNGETRKVEHKILFNFYCFNFPNKEIYNKYKEYYPLNDGMTNSDGVRYDWVTIKTYSVAGKINQPELFDTIGHELSHVYKQDMAGKTMPKNFKNYLKSYSRLESSNKIESAIAKILYYSEQFEQEGYVNGLYYYLKEKGVKILTWEDIKKTDAWVHYKNLYDSIILVDENKEEAQEILNNLYDGKQVNSLLRIGKNGLDTFKNRLLKVIFKMYQDKLDEGIRCTSRHYYEHFISG